MCQPASSGSSVCGKTQREGTQSVARRPAALADQASNAACRTGSWRPRRTALAIPGTQTTGSFQVRDRRGRTPSPATAAARSPRRRARKGARDLHEPVLEEAVHRSSSIGHARRPAAPGASEFLPLRQRKWSPDGASRSWRHADERLTTMAPRPQREARTTPPRPHDMDWAVHGPAAGVAGGAVRTPV